MASTKDEKKKGAHVDAPPPGPVKAAIGYVLGALIGLGVLWVVAAVLRTPPARFVEELPHLTIMAEFKDLRRKEVRQQLALLQRSLMELGLVVQGPISSPILVPGDQPGDMPVCVQLDRLTPEQFDRAAPYFGVGGWLAPRIFALDLQSAVIRACPPPGKAFEVNPERIRQLLRTDAFTELTLSPYSHALRLEEPGDRLKTNVNFGVQTVLVFAMSEKKEAKSAEFQTQLLAAVEDYRNRFRVRSAVCDGSFLHYAAAVRLQSRELPSDQMGPADPRLLAQMATDVGVPRLVARDGSYAQIEVTTDAEGPANTDLGFHVVANLKSFPMLSGLYRFDRDRQPEVRDGR